MGSLSELKLSMTTTICLVGIVFAIFLASLMHVISILWSFSPLVMYGIAVVGSGFFILVEYMIGPSLVVSATNLRYLTPGENPWLEETVTKLASKSGLPTPKSAIVPDETPNAFVFGRTARSATLAVHEGLLKQLTKDEVEGVLGHEFGHIKHKDYIVMTALAAIPLIAYLIARLSFETMRHGRIRAKGKGGALALATIIIAAAFSYVAYLITQLCVMRLSRLREHYADAFSAYLTGQPRKLESALTKITYGLSLSPNPPSGVRTFYIEDPALAKEEFQEILWKKEEYDLDKDGVLDERELELAMEKEAKNTWVKVNTLFATHPPTYRRILLLREIEREIESGNFNTDRIYTRI